MSEVVLIYGKSGAGKSRSLKNFKEDEICYINVIDKRLPFNHSFKLEVTPDSFEEFKEKNDVDIDFVDYILAAVKQMDCKTAVIDDAGYIMTNMFMDSHNVGAKGNDVFKMYNDIADKMWKLIQGLRHMAKTKDKIVYMIFHEDKGDTGDSKLLTVGKLLDQKCNIEGLCTIVFHAMIKGGKHVFVTNSNGFDIAKSPEDMFDMEIENDLKAVDMRIREFYGIKEEK